MRLFDDVRGSDESDARPGEPIYSYYSRNTRSDIARLRQVLEGWFAHYPSKAQSEIHSRFRRGNDLDLRSAAFELCLHELLLSMGCQVDIHPLKEGVLTHPEFGVKAPDGTAFYLEAVTVTGESREEAAGRARLEQVQKVLGDIQSPLFWIGAAVTGTPSRPPNMQGIKARIARCLECLDPDQVNELYRKVGTWAIPTWEFDLGDAELLVYPIPKPEDLRRQPDSSGLRAWAGEGPRLLAVTCPAIRTAVIRKAKAYGEMDRPFVVAVNALAAGIEPIFVEAALYGTLLEIEGRGRPEGRQHTLVRLPDGVWVHRSGPRCTRVSAVLVVDGLIPWDLDQANVCLYHNLCAARPYESALTRLPQGRLCGYRVEYQSGEQIARLLGLPPGWPISG